MYISLIGGISNILLDYILVLGINDFLLPMGVKGAAYASVISQLIMTLTCLYIYIQKTLLIFK